jgi:hypothetical protein
MIWKGLTNRQLCELLVDPKRNGGRDAKGIEEHMHTPLVLWGWYPGVDRTPESMPENIFLQKVHVWTSRAPPAREGSAARALPDSPCIEGVNFRSERAWQLFGNSGVSDCPTGRSCR